MLSGPGKKKIVPQRIRKVVERTRDIYTLKHMFASRVGCGEVWGKCGAQSSSSNILKTAMWIED